MNTSHQEPESLTAGRIDELITTYRDGLYVLWCPVHLEPAFRNLEFFGKKDRSPNFDPRYKGRIKSYQEGDCPNVEQYRRSLCLLKTGMQRLEDVEAQVDALAAAIRYFA